MDETATGLLEAAYNGICLAAENGHTEAWRVEDVSVDRERLILEVTLADGRAAHVSVEVG